jgi:predicted DCC family thiol-disulfide oxidoreductase YuxK
MCGRIAGVLREWGGDMIAVTPSPDPNMESLQLIAPEGRTWEGAAAIEELLTILPRGRLIGWIFHVPLMRGLADRIYRWIARNRYRLGCGEHCSYRGQDKTF